MRLWMKNYRPGLTHVLLCFTVLYIVSGIWYVQLFNTTPPPKPPLDLQWLQKYFQPYNTTYLNSSDGFHTLVDFRGFRFLLNSPKCVGHVFLVIFVHSSPDHADRRETIRRTWASESCIDHKSIRVVFLVGIVKDPELQTELLQEHRRHGDLVQGNFVDSYRNLTYKHIMGLKWICYNCQQAKYILKTDDDMFVDTFQLVDYLNVSFGSHAPPDMMACFVISYANPKRSQRSKWRVSFKEYKKQKYPTYCSGWVIVMSPDVVFRLYQESFHFPFFWVDDVYVSGILGENIGIRHIDFTYKLSITSRKIKNWLSDSTLTRPYLFGYPDMDIPTINALWNKTLLYYKAKGQRKKCKR